MKNNKNELEGLIDNLQYGLLAMPENHNAMIEEEYILGKKVLKLDALANKELANAYWKLDSNAFNNQPAPIFMKLDTLILGGCPIVMMLPKEKTNPQLIKDLEAENLEYVPIGFIDLHKIEKGKFTASGLGIAKPYQGKGLSKYLIYGGAKIAGIKELYIPTQLNNTQAYFAWMHLAPLEVVSSNVFHNEPGTVIYKAKAPQQKEEILKPLLEKQLCTICD